MNKFYLKLIILCLLGCKSSYWDQSEQVLFNQECVEAGYEKQSCDCVVLCLQNDYSNYKTALNEILTKKLSEELNFCIQQCNQKIQK